MRSFALRSSSPSASLSNPTVHTHRCVKRGLIAEYPDLKVFCVHLGIAATELTVGYEGRERVASNEDSPALCAAIIMYVMSGRADYLNDRFVASTWGLGDVERGWRRLFPKTRWSASFVSHSKLRVPSSTAAQKKCIDPVCRARWLG